MSVEASKPVFEDTHARHRLSSVPASYDLAGNPWFDGCSCGHSHIGVGMSMPYVGRVCNGRCAPHDYSGPCYA